MSAALHVRRLHLRTPEREFVPAGRSLLEQAFRLLDWPGADTPGQLFIRKLDLGGLALDMPVAELVLQLRAAVQALASRAVPFDADGAARADAVRVEHPVHVLIELIERACAPRPLNLSAWFWPQLVPELAQGPTRREVQRIALARLCQLPEAQFFLGELLVTLLRAHTADTFVEQLGPEDDRACARALRVLEGEPAHAAPPAAEAPLTRAGIEPALCALASRHVPVWGPAHVRSHWLCQLVLLAERPARVLDPRLHEQAALLVRELAAVVSRRAIVDHPRAAPADAVPSPERASTPPRTADMTDKPRPSAQDERLRGQPPAAADGGQRQTSAQALGPKPAATQTRERTDVTAPQLTEFAGLPFLLNVLSRLGIADFLAQHPDLIEVELARRVLLRACERLEVPEADPLRSALQLTAASTSERCTFTLPAGWRALFGELGTPSSQPLEVLLDAWLVALERWLERYAHVKVSEVARRRAGVVWSRTHLDLVFDLEDADATLRRAALDLNPGYLPWFGRVVTFHYVRGTAWRARAAQSGGDPD